MSAPWIPCPTGPLSTVHPAKAMPRRSRAHPSHGGAWPSPASASGERGNGCMGNRLSSWVSYAQDAWVPTGRAGERCARRGGRFRRLQGARAQVGGTPLRTIGVRAREEEEEMADTMRGLHNRPYATLHSRGVLGAPRRASRSGFGGAFVFFLALLSLAATGRASERIFLENGMEVLLLPDPASRLVTSIVVIDAGSSRESARLSGASHFLEHMLFNGTERRTQKQLYDEEDAAGGFNNAFTRRTHAAFMMTMPSRRLELALDLQADMLFHSRISTKKFEKERGIILEEMAKDRDSESYVLERVLLAETYPASSYGLPVLGSEASIRRLESSEVRSYYNERYVPENMVALVLGGFDPAEARAALERTLGAARPSGVWPEGPPAPPPITQDRTVQHLLDVSAGRVRMVWNAPGPGDPKLLPSEIACELQLTGDGSPLAAALEEAFPGRILRCSGSLETGAGFGRLIVDVEFDGTLEAEAVASRLQQAITQLPAPTGERLEAWKIAGRASQIFAQQRSYMFAPLFSEEIVRYGLAALERRLETRAAIRIEDVRSAASSLGSGPAWTILITPRHPVAAGSSAPVMKMGPGGMPPGMGRAMAGRAREGVPAPPVVETERSPLPYPVTDTTTAGGSRLLVIAPPPDGSLSIYLLIEGRNYLEPDGKAGITELLHDILGAGPRGMSDAEFQVALERIGGSLQTADRGFIPFDDYYSQPDFSFIRFQALDEYAPEAFGLLGRLLRQPRLDEATVERERNRLVTRLRRDAGSARARAREKLWSVLLGEDHPEARGPFGRPDDVSGITAEDLRAHLERLLDPERIWMGVVTGQPVDRVAQWASGLVPEADRSRTPAPSVEPAAYAAWVQRGQLGARARGRLKELTRSPLAFGAVRSAAQAETYEIEVPGESGGRGYVLDALLLSPGRTGGVAERVAGGLLSSRLAFDLREEQGMAYGIGASVSRLGDHWLYMAGAGTRPENLEAMRRGFVAARQQSEEPTPVEVDRTANKMYGQLLRRQEIRINQAMFCVWSARRGEDPLGWWGEAESLLGVSPAAIDSVLEALAAEGPALVVSAR